MRLCARMRAHSLLRRTPVVFLSNRDDCDTRHEALKAGADEFLPKPAPSREMLIRLELLLKRFGEIEAGAEHGSSLRGAIELVGAPAVLQICHLNGLTGVLVARRGSVSVRVGFRQGQIVSAVGPDHQGEAVIYDFVGWPQGQFEFDRRRGGRRRADRLRLQRAAARGLPAARRAPPATRAEAQDAPLTRTARLA